jgi:hypothetical protein
MACICCGAFAQTPSPSRLIERSRPGPSLLAHVLAVFRINVIGRHSYARVIFGDSGKSGNASTNTSFVQKIFHITE